MNKENGFFMANIEKINESEIGYGNTIIFCNSGNVYYIYENKMTTKSFYITNIDNSEIKHYSNKELDNGKNLIWNNSLFQLCEKAIIDSDGFFEI